MLARMSNLPVLLVVVFLASPAAGAADKIGVLSGAEVRQFLLGHTMTGEYPDGRRWTETFRKDGTTAYSEGGDDQEGQLTIRGKLACFTYGVSA